MALMFEGPLQSDPPEHHLERPVQNASAEFVAQVVPAAMLAGHKYQVSVTFRNIGREYWSGGNGLALGLINSALDRPAVEDEVTWGLNLVSLAAEEPIAPGEEATFLFAVVAPAAAGEHVFCAMLLHNDQWIGEAAPPVCVQVDVNATSFVSQLVPKLMICGETYEVAIMMQNTGTTTWQAGQFYRLGHCGEPHTIGHENRWAAARATLPASASVAPGEIATFRFNVQAPADAGRYNFQWRMLQEEIEWFGERTVNVAVTCTPPAVWPKRLESILTTFERLLDKRVEEAVARRLPALTTPQVSETDSRKNEERLCKIPPEMASEIDAVFGAWDKAASPGCAIGYFQHGESRYERGYGMSSIEHGIPLRRFSVFPAGSLAKQFIAFSMLLLARDGELTLDDPLRLHVPEFPPFGDAITLRHLIHHTSGLQHDGLVHAAGALRGEASGVDPDLIEVTIRPELRPVIPGEQFRYSQAGYTLLQLVLQRRAGMSVSRFVNERIFKPLSMGSSRFCGNPKTVVARRVSAYEPHSLKGFVVADPDFTQTAASMFFTSVEDMARWDGNFFTGAVGGDVAEEMQRRGKLNNGCQVGYAFGLMTGHKGVKTFEHSGTGGGCRSYYVRFVQSHASIVILSNQSELNPIPLAHSVARIVNRWIRKIG